MGKEPVTMSRTLLQDNVVDEVTIYEIIAPTVNAGTSGTGDTQAVDTVKKCPPNAVVKYINLRLQSGIRDIAPQAPGFLEYAIVMFEEQGAVPTVPSSMTSAIGTSTLGNICKNLYRGNCIWDGAYRVSRELPEVLDLKIKLPLKGCKMKRGYYLCLFKNFRTNDVSDTTTDCRTWVSHMYKRYN